MLVRLYSKSFKLGFNTMWTKNFQMYKSGFIKGRGTRDQIANIPWIIEKTREFQEKKNLLLLHWLHGSLCVDHKKLWKILREMGIPCHHTCLLRNLILDQKKQLELDMEQQTGIPNWERSMSRPYIVTWLFNFYAEYIMWNARLDGSQAGIKIPRRNINNFRYADNTTLMAGSEE